MERCVHPPSHDSRPQVREAPSHGIGLRAATRIVTWWLPRAAGRRVIQPAWYLNLAENPEVEVQVAAERFHARAFTATYQAKTDRDIPVVILEPRLVN